MFSGAICPNARISFMSLWDSIKGLNAWDKNPWVWVVSFNVLSVTGREYSFRYEPAPDAMVLSRVVQLPTEKEWFYFAFRKPKK